MSKFIILTAGEADKVRGLSLKGHALAPFPLKDGTLALPLSVIDDPAHAALAALLKGLPTRDVDEGTPGATPVAARVGGEFDTDPVAIDKYAYKSTWRVGELVIVAGSKFAATASEAMRPSKSGPL